MNYKLSGIIFFLLITSTLFALPTTLMHQQSQVADARSVHLWYDNIEATLFYNEATVSQSAPGSYFMVCGFSHGYFGMQELGNSEKVIIFSVWVPGNQNDPNIVAADKMVNIIWKADDVRTDRFGGEGTGAQSFFNYNWQINQTYKYLIKSYVNGNRTAYEAYFFINETNKWKHLATFETLSGTSENLQGLYSFVEDFLRNYKSPSWERSVSFTNTLAVTKNQQVQKLDRVTFTTIENHPLNSINAWVNGDKFVLATGGNIQNTTAVNSTLQRNSVNSLPGPFLAMYKTAEIGRPTLKKEKTTPVTASFPNKFNYNGGAFIFNSNNKSWTEKNNDGTFTFKEVSRNKDQALLYDQGRNIWLRLDNARSVCEYSQDKTNWMTIYQIRGETN